MPRSPEQSNTRQVLIGEDDLDDQEFLKEIFSSIDDSYSVQFGSKGEEILSMLDSNPNDDLPCLIVLDYNMPGLNGVEVLKELKKNSRYDAIPKIIWSTSRSASYRETCLSLGAYDYLVKPSNIHDLAQVCRYMLSACITGS